MAITVPIITEFSDKGLKSAQAGFDNLKKKVGEAEGGFGKMKAGFGAASDFISANAGKLAAAAGSALVGLAVKGIAAFQELAIGASKFADATGLAVEEASRWTEVAGDMGVEAGTVQSAINRMNKAIGEGSSAFADMGAEIEYTKEGTVDVNKTFLNTIQALKNIKDPTERAATATKVLGKSWTDLAELINVGSDELEKSLAAVSDTKVISQEEVDRAKKFREAQDELSDSIEDLSIALGQKLVPALADAATYLAKFVDFSTNTDTAVKTGNVFLDSAVKLWDLFGGGADEAGDKLGLLNDVLDRSRYGLGRIEGELKRVSKATIGFDYDLNGLIDTWDDLLGRLSKTEAFNNVADSLDQVYEAAGRALEEKTPEAARAAQNAVSDLYREVADYIVLLGNIPAEKQTEILALLDMGKYDEALRLLEELAKDRESTIRIRTVGGTSVRPGDTPSETMGGGGVNVIDPSTGQSHYLPPGIDFGALAGGGGRRGATSLTVNVAGSVTSEADLIETIRKGLVRSQRNGAQLVYSNV